MLIYEEPHILAPENVHTKRSPNDLRHFLIAPASAAEKSFRYAKATEELESIAPQNADALLRCQKVAAIQTGKEAAAKDPTIRAKQFDR